MTTQIHNITFKVSLRDSQHDLDLVQIIGKNSVKSHLSECKRNAHSTDISENYLRIGINGKQLF